MKKIVTLMMSFVIALAYAQDDKMPREQADHYFDLEQFSLSINYYKQAIDGGDVDPAVTYRLAESFRKTFQYKAAEQYYREVFKSSSSEFPLSGYYYGLMQKLNGKYSESMESFEEFIADNYSNSKLTPFVEQALVDRAGSEAAISEATPGTDRYSLALESFNTEFNDYAPSVSDSNQLMITSGRMRSNTAAIDERYGEGFSDNYFFQKNNGRWQDRTRQNVRNLNTRFNDGGGSFNRTGNKYYFTACGQEGSQCRIVFSELRSGRWTDPKVLNDNVNVAKFESKHPSVSPGGDTLLFVTDRPGGAGGYDIWMSIDSGEDNWGPAINLGPGINTRMNEEAPSFAEFNHVFFFASDGHQGFGGMDLYMAKRFSNGRQAVYNLGYPFNSNRDDCFISFGNRQIYMSSNREDGAGGFDIYSCSIKSPLSFVSRVSLKNEAGRNDITLASLKSEGSWLDLFSTRKEDRIEYEDLTYERKKIVDRMVANRQQHRENNNNDFSTVSNEEYEQLATIAQSQFRKVELQQRYRKTLLSSIKRSRRDVVTVSGVLVDSVSGKPLGSINLHLMNEQGDILKITSTNESGVFRLTNLPGGENLYLRYQVDATSNIDPGVVDLVVAADRANTFTFDNIYFDTDHYDLRIEAKEVLNKLGAFLKLVPDSQVEIFAYADDRGTNEYNLQLSKNRGEEVRKYLGGIGVDETSISIIAKGRQSQDEGLANDEKRQFNRRVEFYINGQKSSALITSDGNK
ncbi:MAG TPA: OmpA family protein [Cyclobacteriaceae bacterium]